MNHTSKNFKQHELACKCGCGVNRIKKEALDKLQAIRDELGPLTLTSAYRCANHPVEARKARPGQHNHGHAFDISAPDGSMKFKIIEVALKHGATGIGIHKNFIHVDWRESTPVAWLY